MHGPAHGFTSFGPSWNGLDVQPHAAHSHYAGVGPRQPVQGARRTADRLAHQRRRLSVQAVRANRAVRRPGRGRPAPIPRRTDSVHSGCSVRRGGRRLLVVQLRGGSASNAPWHSEPWAALQQAESSRCKLADHPCTPGPVDTAIPRPTSPRVSGGTRRYSLPSSPALRPLLGGLPSQIDRKARAKSSPGIVPFDAPFTVTSIPFPCT